VYSPIRPVTHTFLAYSDEENSHSFFVSDKDGVNLWNENPGNYICFFSLGAKGMFFSLLFMILFMTQPREAKPWVQAILRLVNYVI